MSDKEFMDKIKENAGNSHMIKDVKRVKDSEKYKVQLNYGSFIRLDIEGYKAVKVDVLNGKAVISFEKVDI